MQGHISNLFLKPAVAPVNDEEQEAFDTLDDLLDENKPATAICWAVQQHEMLTDKTELQVMRHLLHGAFKGRMQRNWALLTICAKQVKLPLSFFICK